MTPLRPLLFALLAIASPLRAEDAPPNTLTDAERAAGWRLLFDGRTSEGWRGYRKEAFPDKGWAVEEGSIRHLPKGGGGDIVTRDKFENYELSWEWSIDAGGNGGLKYFVIEDRENVIGHEYQMMGEPDLAAIRKDPKHATGSFYDVIPVSLELPLRPPGQWNQSRVVIRGNHVEHWLNGKQVVAYELGSEPVKAAIATSKFKKIERFGTRFPHHILLQDHGGDVRYRSIKLLPIKP